MRIPRPTTGNRIWGSVVSEQRGLTGHETAIVLIAFVVVSSAVAFGASSTGLFPSDKAEETLQAGLSETRGTVRSCGILGGGAASLDHQAGAGRSPFSYRMLPDARHRDFPLTTGPRYPCGIPENAAPGALEQPAIVFLGAVY